MIKTKYLRLPIPIVQSEKITSNEMHILCLIVGSVMNGYRDISTKKIGKVLKIKDRNIRMYKQRLKDLGLIDWENVKINNFQVSRFSVDINKINEFFGCEIYSNDQDNTNDNEEEEKPNGITDDTIKEKRKEALKELRVLMAKIAGTRRFICDQTNADLTSFFVQMLDIYTNPKFQELFTDQELDNIKDKLNKRLYELTEDKKYTI